MKTDVYIHLAMIQRTLRYNRMKTDVLIIRGAKGGREGDAFLMEANVQGKLCSPLTLNFLPEIPKVALNVAQVPLASKDCVYNER